MDSSKHSKLPWQVVEWANRDSDGTVNCTGTQIVDADGYLISGATVEDCSEQEEADVSFIVLAANSHDQLVAALKEIVENAKAADQGDIEAWAQELYECGKTARAALAAAGA